MTASGAPRDEAPPTPAARYRSLRRVARVSSVLIVVGAAVGTFDMLVRGGAYVGTGVLLAAPDWLPLDHAYSRVDEWGRGPLNEIERVLVTVRSVWFGIMLAAGFAFLVWLTGAVANLRALGSQSPRVPVGWAVASLLGLIPALFAAHRNLSAQAEQLAIPVIVLAGLAAPLIVVRRLWISRGMRAADQRTSGSQAAKSWNIVLVWWLAFTGFWLASRLALTAFAGSDSETYSSVESALRVTAMGTLEFIAGIAWAIAGVFIVRIILRVTAMQESSAPSLPARAPPEQPEVTRAEEVPATDARAVDPHPAMDASAGPRRTAVQWECQSCEVMNPTALRFCQNCAGERG